MKSDLALGCLALIFKLLMIQYYATTVSLIFFQHLNSQKFSHIDPNSEEKKRRKTRENDVRQIEVTYLTKLALKKHSLKHGLKSHPNDSKV